MRVDIFDILRNHYIFENANVKLLNDSSLLCVYDQSGILHNFICNNILYYTTVSERQLRSKGEKPDDTSIQSGCLHKGVDNV